MRQINCTPWKRGRIVSPTYTWDESLTVNAPLKATILVLDDDSAVLSSLQFLLETHGFAVCSFRNPAAMLDWAEQNLFDCVVVDYKMPGIDGLKVAEQLRRRGSMAPIILVTGFPDNSIFVKAAAAGIQQVLLKPHIEESLVSHIHDHLSARAMPL